MEEEKKDNVNIYKGKHQIVSSTQNGNQEKLELSIKEIASQVIKDFAADIEYLKDK